ncbi:hypothetical protein PAPYR_1509 [Paratrimastix pyriformis]|uniref:Uncharacterized protein n=1 Tax=Paratrimastix pyriformis TaxID=342808 RepID=A0ABQ8UYK7_9EUKA|nr:hypothetical protein PAPYR_1509 [Paratrimastix pyriformis]
MRFWVSFFLPALALGIYCGCLTERSAGIDSEECCNTDGFCTWNVVPPLGLNEAIFYEVKSVSEEGAAALVFSNLEDHRVFQRLDSFNMTMRGSTEFRGLQLAFTHDQNNNAQFFFSYHVGKTPLHVAIPKEPSTLSVTVSLDLYGVNSTDLPLAGTLHIHTALPAALGPNSSVLLELIDMDTGARAALITPATNATGGEGFLWQANEPNVTVGQRVAVRATALADTSLVGLSATLTVRAGVLLFPSRLTTWAAGVGNVIWAGLPPAHYPSLSVDLVQPARGARHRLAENATTPGPSPDGYSVLDVALPCMLGETWELVMEAASAQPGEPAIIMRSSPFYIARGFYSYSTAPEVAGQPIGLRWRCEGLPEGAATVELLLNGSRMAALEDLPLDPPNASMPTAQAWPTGYYQLRYSTTAFGARDEWEGDWVTIRNEVDAFCYPRATAPVRDSLGAMSAEMGPFGSPCPWRFDVRNPLRLNPYVSIKFTVSVYPITPGSLRIYDGPTNASALLYSTPATPPVASTTPGVYLTSTPDALMIFAPACSQDLLEATYTALTASEHPGPNLWWLWLLVAGLLCGCAILGTVSAVHLLKAHRLRHLRAAKAAARREAREREPLLPPPSISPPVSPAPCGGLPPVAEVEEGTTPV